MSGKLKLQSELTSDMVNKRICSEVKVMSQCQGLYFALQLLLAQFYFSCFLWLGFYVGFDRCTKI